MARAVGVARRRPPTHRRAGGRVGPSLGSLVRASRPAAREEYLKESESSGYHDSLIDACASVFSPGSPLALSTGYSFLTSMPLFEKQEKSLDLLLSNPVRSAAVFIECKAGASNPTREIRSTYGAIRAVSANRKYLEGVVGHPLQGRMFVLCTPSGLTQTYASALKRLYDSGEISSGDPPLYQWQLHAFRGEALQDFHMGGPAPRPGMGSEHFDSSLAKALRRPVPAQGTSVFAECYPSSHLSRLSMVALRYVLTENAKRGEERGTLRVADLTDFFSRRSTLCHYAAPALGPRMALRVIEGGRVAGLIRDMEPPEEGVLHFVTRGNQDNTILTQYKKALGEAIVKQKARRLAGERYELEQGKHRRVIETWDPSAAEK